MRQHHFRPGGPPGRITPDHGTSPRKLIRAAWLLALLALSGCALLFPPRFERVARLVPRADQGTERHGIRDASVSYEGEGFRLEVEYMTDARLNEMFAAESAQGRYSTNPYTYANQLDPSLGYVPARFTVFRVYVHNLGLARLELRPLRCQLMTDRGDETLEPYGIQTGSAAKSLESYYRSLKGSSGNDHYLFTQRMAIVRTNSFLSGEPIYRGESYGGFIVFDPLDDDVGEVTLEIRDLVVRFNAYDKPLQTTGVAFSFGQEISLEAYHDQDDLIRTRARTTAALGGPSQVTGYVSGDMAREPNAIDAYIRTRLDELRACFEPDFGAGTASPGQVDLRFTILAHGGVEEVQVVGSSIGSTDVEGSIAGRVKQWRFRPSTGTVTQPAAADSLQAPAPVRQQPPTSVRVFVAATIEFGETNED
jgi:hypothetical protein